MASSPTPANDGPDPHLGPSGEPLTQVNRPSSIRERSGVVAAPTARIPAIPPDPDPVLDRPTDSARSGLPNPPSAITIPDATVARSPLTPVEPPSLGEAPTVTPTPQASETAVPQPPPPQAVLRVVRGEIPNVRFLLLDGRNFLGRASPEKPSDIDLTAQERVEQVWVSRQHAVITVDRGLIYVEDLNSLNGTFVNRARIYPGQPRVLQPGDVVQVGTVQMRLEL